MATILYESSRVQQNEDDFLLLKGIETLQNEVASIDIEWNEIEGMNSNSLTQFLKDAKKAISEVLEGRAAVAAESLKESLLSSVANQLNDDLPGNINTPTVNQLKTRVY